MIHATIKRLVLVAVLLAAVEVPAQVFILDPGSLSAPEGNGLLNNLAAHWKADEGSGDMIDSHFGSGFRDLAETGGTLGSGTGILNGDRVFDGTTYASDVHEIWNDMTGVSWTFTCWVRFAELPADPDIQYLMFKVPGADPGVTDGYYSVYLEHSGGILSFVCQTKTDTVTITPSPAVATNTWYFVAARHDAINETGTVSFGTGASLTHGTPAANFDPVLFSDGAFALGGTVHPLIGELDEISLWQDRVLSDDDIAALFNGGSGLPLTSYTY